jgi:hypothetical protein
VWKQRPLPDVLLRYCTDATMFFALRTYYEQTELIYAEALQRAVQERLDDSCDPGFSSVEASLRQVADISLISSLLAMDRHPASESDSDSDATLL